MAVRILAIGDSTYSFFKDGEEEYLKRLGKYARVQFQVIKGIKGGKNFRPDQFADLEGKEFLRHIRKNETVVLLDEKGKEYSSEQFAGQIENWLAHFPDIVFVIGGAYGFSRELYDRSNALLSLSRMTFSHQMVRMFFLEQLYRAFTILNGESYHNS